MGKNAIITACTVWATLLIARVGVGDVTIRCAPVVPESAGAALASIECTIRSDVAVGIRGVQLDLPCSLEGDVGAYGTAIVEDIFAERTHVDPPFLFGPSGIVASNVNFCNIVLAPPPGVIADLPANTTRYLATFQYRLADCANGAFLIRLEGVSHPPARSDASRVIGHILQLIPVQSTREVLLARSDCPCQVHAECTDNNVCTIDRCIENQCVSRPEVRECDDGSFCRTNDHCELGLCISAPISPCLSDQYCDEAQNRCVRCLTNAHCDDGLFCTSLDRCINNVCLYSPTCAGDSVCDEQTNRCAECLRDEDCDDDRLCTHNTCDRERGVCESVNVTGRCNDERFCTIVDICDEGECVGSGERCPGEICDEQREVCVPPDCPPARILSVLPASGVVDARWPHPPADNSVSFRKGIGTIDEPIILQLSASGATRGCFSLCETAFDPETGSNEVVGVIEGAPGIYRLILKNPLTPGAATTISYLVDSHIRYISHPGNVNADSASSAIDIVRLIDYLNGVVVAPFGLYSTDINHSGALGATDIIALIDVLNGAGALSPWAGTSLPSGAGCP